MQQVTVGGKVYGIPLVIETLVLYYNKDLLKTPPKTFNELEDLTKDKRFAFSSEKGRSTAFLAKWTDFYMSYGLMAGYGGYVFGADGTDSGDIGLNNKGAVEAVEYAEKWFSEYWPKGMQDNTSADDFIQQTFMDGSVAMTMTASLIDCSGGTVSIISFVVPVRSERIVTWRSTICSGHFALSLMYSKAWKKSFQMPTE